MASGPNALLRLFHTAQLEHGQTTGLGGRRAVANLVGGSHVDEGLQLVVQVALGLSAPDHPPHDRGDAMQERHAPSRTLATANETLFQRSRWCSSWRRPEAVKR